MVTKLDVDSLDPGKFASEVSAAEAEAIPPLGAPDFQYSIVVPESEINAWPNLGSYIKSNPHGIVQSLITEMKTRYAGKQVDMDNAFYVRADDTVAVVNTTPAFAEL
jgi:hypothetical protein